MSNTEYDNTNRGALFKARERRTDRSPTHTGEVTVECPPQHVSATCPKCDHQFTADGTAQNVEYWLSAWVKEARSTGQRFFSLALTKKEQQPGVNGFRDRDDDGADDELDEDIPF